LGDVGILLKNKFNTMQTIFCNGIVNLTALIGVVLGLALGSIGEDVQIYILSFVAGNFIYIGADIWRNLLKNKDFCSNLL
jgi:zinc transporter ZupT